MDLYTVHQQDKCLDKVFAAKTSADSDGQNFCASLCRAVCNFGRETRETLAAQKECGRTEERKRNTPTRQKTRFESLRRSLLQLYICGCVERQRCQTSSEFPSKAQLQPSFETNYCFINICWSKERKKQMNVVHSRNIQR